MATTKQTSIYPINVQIDGKFDVNMLERQLRSVAPWCTGQPA